MHHKHIPTFVIVVIIAVAVIAFLIAMRPEHPGKAVELVVKYQKAQITPCCCIKTDPNGIRRDHTALYYAHSAQECTCFPTLNWVPTDPKNCHIRVRK